MLIEKCDYSVINFAEHFCDKTFSIFVCASVKNSVQGGLQ